MSMADADRIQLADGSRMPPAPDGGVCNVRGDEQFVPTLTKHSTGISEKTAEFSANGNIDERDKKKKQQFKGRYLLWYGLLLLSFSICLSRTPS